MAHLTPPSLRLSTLTILVLALGAPLLPTRANAQPEKNPEVVCQGQRAAYGQRASAENALALAHCLDDAGKTASAYEQYQDTLNRLKYAERPDLVAQVRERVDLLTPELSRLSVELQDGASSPGQFRVTLDGELVAGHTMHRTPVDPGTHQLEATAPEYETWSRDITIGPEGDEQAVVIPRLTPVDAAPAVSGSTQPLAPAALHDAQPSRQAPDSAAPSPRPADPETEQAGSQGIPTSVYVSGGVTLALTAGVVLTGIVAQNRKQDFEDANDDLSNSQNTVEGLRDDAERSQILNTALAGGAVVGAGVTIWLLLTQDDAAASGRPALAPWFSAQRDAAGIVYSGAL